MSENLLPEEKARKKIDMLLKKAGWSIVPRDQYSPGQYFLKGNPNIRLCRSFPASKLLIKFSADVET